MEKEKKEKPDIKMWVGMTLFVLILVLMGGAFWSVVGKQAELAKEEEAREEASAMNAVYVEVGDILKLGYFVDMETGTVFTADAPADGIYNKNGRLVEDEVLENGDTVKIYGDGIMTRSDPAQYPGVKKMQKTGRASLEDTKKYMDEVEKRYSND